MEDKMKKYTELLRRLVDIPTVSGFEKTAFDGLKALLSGYDFDSVYGDGVGNVVLVKRAQYQAPSIVLDAHLDEIGFRVSEIGDDGFLTAVTVGGIDPVILASAEVTVWGKEPLRGVVSLKMPEGDERLKKIYVDVGYPAEDLRDLVSIGDMVSFTSPVTVLGSTEDGAERDVRELGAELSEDVECADVRLMGHAFDDKALVAALVCAVDGTPRESLAFDVYVVLSSREEVGGAGAASALGGVGLRTSWSPRVCEKHPVAALVTDVNFATAPGVSEDESGRLGGGPMVSLSAVTDRELTDMILQKAETLSLPVSPVVEATGTGTNATFVYMLGRGVPCVVVSLPESGMHTASECISLKDAAHLIRLLRGVICDGGISARMEQREAEFRCMS